MAWQLRANRPGQGASAKLPHRASLLPSGLVSLGHLNCARYDA
ncbi:hypothetical protein N177_4210 [Lutibaculum baratangense AMV1]|uniref:Uncharacterized protein n=1 Tax=Lutibaculum baratangense AMV1 TaxID=631454 RepID=V4RGT2_9HYPH|nr:hypothetical protein N177_4210 [Lutibaculum baratangense AMV1]